MADANRLRNIVAHELGHVVGFDQAPCGNSIMSEGAPTDTLTCNDVGSLNVRYRLNESPIVVDTVGDGLALSSASGGVRFDFASNGGRDRAAWPMAGDDGFLTLDRNGNGRVDNGGELFGDHTLLSTGQMARDGFEALRDFDRNADGVIDARDPVFKSLRLWFDIYRDGVSQPLELWPLRLLGIRSLSVRPQNWRSEDEHGNIVVYRAEVQGMGGALLAYDVYLTIER